MSDLDNNLPLAEMWVEVRDQIDEDIAHLDRRQSETRDDYFAHKAQALSVIRDRMDALERHHRTALGRQ